MEKAHTKASSLGKAQDASSFLVGHAEGLFLGRCGGFAARIRNHYWKGYNQDKATYDDRIKVAILYRHRKLNHCEFVALGQALKHKNMLHMMELSEGMTAKTTVRMDGAASDSKTLLLSGAARTADAGQVSGARQASVARSSSQVGAGAGAAAAPQAATETKQHKQRKSGQRGRG